MDICCSLTDVSTVWSADCSGDLVDQCVRQTFAEEKLLKLRQDEPEAGSQQGCESLLAGLQVSKCAFPAGQPV